MGVLTGAGCAARALGPACVALLYARHGPDAAFGVTAALTLATLLLLRALYPRLQPPALPAAARAAAPARAPAPAALELRPLPAGELRPLREKLDT